MYTPGTHRPLLSGRIAELLESLKTEFEALAHDANMFKMQRDDYERKLQAQLGELGNLQQTLYDLERNHTKVKQTLEEEMRWRRQSEIGPSSGVSTTTVTANHTNNGGAAFSAVRTDSGPGPIDKGSPLAPTNFGALPSTATMFPYAMNALDSNKRNYAATTTPSTSTINPTPTKRARGEPFYDQSAPRLSPLGDTPPPSRIKNEKKETEPLPIAPIREQTDINEVNTKELSQSKPTSHGSRTPPDIRSHGNGITEDKNVGTSEKASSPETSESKRSSSDDQTCIRKDDWIFGYNPSVSKTIAIDLKHTEEHSSVVCCVRFSNDGNFLSTGCNRSAQIYDVETGVKVSTFTDENAKAGDLYIRSVCFSPDGKFLAAGAEDKTVKVWDIEKKTIRHSLVGHELDIYSLDFSSDGRFIVSGSGDKKAKIWNMDTGKCQFTLGNDEAGPKDGVTSVAISPDGRFVAAGSLDRIVRLWETETGYLVDKYEGHLDSVYSVAFSPDGKYLASGSLDKTLKLWDIGATRPRSRCRLTFNGHKDFVLSVAFSPDGNWLISGSKDRSVQFWDPRTASPHLMLQGHKNSVISVAVSPSGKNFATGSGDCRARIWSYTPIAG
jgi:glucose repression regulatory protein TUP1